MTVKEKDKLTDLVMASERVDEIGFGALQVIQNPKEFCYGVDAVILADFAAKHVRRSTQLLFDLGTGTGIIPLILSPRGFLPESSQKRSVKWAGGKAFFDSR